MSSSHWKQPSANKRENVLRQSLNRGKGFVINFNNTSTLSGNTATNIDSEVLKTDAVYGRSPRT